MVSGKMREVKSGGENGRRRRQAGMGREELEIGCQKGKGVKCGRKCEKKEEEGGCGMCC